MEKPLVSVLIPTYNAEKFLAETIESVLDLNYSSWELIIVNDNSTDSTINIAETYCLHDKRIRVYSNKDNLGDYPNRIKSATYAKGKYLKYIDHDDILYKYSLDYMVEAMEKYPNAALGIGYNRIDDVKPYPIYYTSKETYYEEYIGKSFLAYGPSAAIIKRDAFEEVGGFSGKAFLGDHELWLKLALNFPVVKLQPSLIWYRTHEGQESKKEKRDIRNKAKRYRLASDWLINSRHLFTKEDFYFAEKKMKRNYARSILRYILVEGKIKDALYLYSQSDLTLSDLLVGFKKYL